MDWAEAQSKIRANVRIGADVNTPASTYRFVQAVDSTANNERYGYCDEHCFTVSIGRTNRIKIPWSMLEECFAQLKRSEGYDGAYFRERFPLQAQDHPCHVHVVGRIFIAAGIAYTNGAKYWISTT
jgi:hypothetical protein